MQTVNTSSYLCSLLSCHICTDFYISTFCWLIFLLSISLSLSQSPTASADRVPDNQNTQNITNINKQTDILMRPGLPSQNITQSWVLPHLLPQFVLISPLMANHRYTSAATFVHSVYKQARETTICHPAHLWPNCAAVLDRKTHPSYVGEMIFAVYNISSTFIVPLCKYI